jgi:hypothetical protein
MFMIRTIVTKPADVTFRLPQLVAGTSLTLGQWVAQQPGYVVARTRRFGANKVINTVVFDTQANAEAYLAQLATNSEYVARQTYNAAHGITSVVRKFQEVA